MKVKLSEMGSVVEGVAATGGARTFTKRQREAAPVSLPKQINGLYFSYPETKWIHYITVILPALTQNGCPRALSHSN